jgi:Uncharacterised protein conserved in bacteria (DUF2336)
MAASEKLSHLLQLADQGPALRAALAEEVTELLSNWPPDYPDNMRSVCEALLVKAARDVDAVTRARLREQLAFHPGLVQRVLPRETSQVLVETARAGEDLSMALAESLSLHEDTARKILDDDSGTALAVACKGANIDRAAFSALALLTRPRRGRSDAFALLDAFDNVPETEAARQLREWRENKAA